MNRNSVKVMIYSYILNLKSYINTYISVTYTESTVSNHLPKGNHNNLLIEARLNSTVSNHLPKGNHNMVKLYKEQKKTVSNHLPKGNHNNIQNRSKFF